MKEENKELPQLNVTAKWLDNIYERITKITNIERICRTGMPSDDPKLTIYDDEAQAQYQARMLDLFMDEIEMILPDIKRKIDPDVFKQISLKMEIIQKKSNQKHLRILNDNVSKTVNYELTPEYSYLLRNLAKIRSDLVLALSPLLYGETEKENNRRNIR